VAHDERGVTFRWKDYRAHGSTRYKTMTLVTEEFMRRFLLHVLPSGFHRIRHYGLLANARRKTHIATARELLHQPAPEVPADPSDNSTGNGAVRPTFVCRHCGAPMLIIETFARAPHIRGPPGPPPALKPRRLWHAQSRRAGIGQPLTISVTDGSEMAASKRTFNRTEIAFSSVEN
jgi:hypothetical protein